MKIFTLTQKFSHYLKEHELFPALEKVNKYLLFLVKKRWYRFKGKYGEIEQDGIKIISHSGKTKFYWKGIELTAGIGITTSISVLGDCYNSNPSDWNVRRENNAKLVIKNKWNALPLSQIWEITLSDRKEINLIIKMELEEDLTIDEKGASLTISERYNKWKKLFRGGSLACSEDILPEIKN